MKAIEKILVLIVIYTILLYFAWVIIGTRAHGYSIKFNESEQVLMQMAYREGKYLEKPEILQAILLNETVAGRFGRHGDKHLGKHWKRHSYGIMQIQFNTAIQILRQNGELKKWEAWSDQRLKIYLKNDDKFNIHVARLIVQQLWKKYHNWDYVLLAYNVGTGNVRRYGLKRDPNGYLAKAYYHLDHTIKKFNAPVKYLEMLERMTQWDIKQILNLKITYKNWRDSTTNNVDNVYHTIIKGDTLSGLAKHYLGNMKRWTEIQALNLHVVPTNMKIGTTLTIRR